jgi:glycogen debranching enzyme
MQTAIETVKDKFYISASASMIDPRRLILKDEDLFGLFDRYGDIIPFGTNDTGLYYRGARHLSAYELRMEGRRLLHLSGSVDEDNVAMSVDLTNPDFKPDDKLVLAKDSIHILRSRVLLQDTCYESIAIRNFGGKSVRFRLELAVDADFRDIFEIRGLQRQKRGNLLSPSARPDGLDLSYEGLDKVRRTTRITSLRPPDSREENSLFFTIDLKPEGKEDLLITINCIRDGEPPVSLGFTQAVSERRHKLDRQNQAAAEINTSNERFNESLKRSLSDINMMLTEQDEDLYPYGGIPWFCTPFGRDGLITAIECLWVKPRMAKGVLRFLAKTQATEVDPSKAAEPGKILHEARQGEMAALREIPFGLYYGSVDSTPLFLMLASAYWKRTGDDDLIRELWPSLKKAIAWVQTYGDPDGDGFLEYAPHREGLRNQGWKDSQDSVFHADGTLASGPIALCEVQAYNYAAKKRAAGIAQFMGDEVLAGKLEKESQELREKFNRQFWDEELGTYVLALDGKKKPCRVVASNAGHALFTGIAEPMKAIKAALSLTSSRMFSGWGIRTVADGEARFNPMSYHNGSIWPHDNALIASGLSWYGLKEYFLNVFGGMFEASVYMESNRLPELFCGFPRRKKAAPTLYPVACSPQTWAAGSLLFMLQASLGLSFEADKGMIIFRNPVLPAFLKYVTIKNLLVSKDKTVDLNIKRHEEGVTIEIVRKSRGVSVLTYK